VLLCHAVPHSPEEVAGSSPHGPGKIWHVRPRRSGRREGRDVEVGGIGQCAVDRVHRRVRGRPVGAHAAVVGLSGLYPPAARVVGRLEDRQRGPFLGEVRAEVLGGHAPGEPVVEAALAQKPDRQPVLRLLVEDVIEADRALPDLLGQRGLDHLQGPDRFGVVLVVDAFLPLQDFAHGHLGDGLRRVVRPTDLPVDHVVVHAAPVLGTVDRVEEAFNLLAHS